MNKENNTLTIPRMGKELIGTVADLIKVGILKKIVIVNEQIEQERFSICSSCEYLVEDRCRKCGCFMKKKVKLAPAKCPIDKWGKIEE
jgi:predicted Zn-ribbon and HTH transcriptional regulator